ncbi:MAG: hypothetical protein HXY41_01785 [Chloroflexi bacterium]|nr:hypothetical protein [Chloroflexota bacterium]
MGVLEAAILRTVLYADVFNFPVTVAEIHHFLIHHEPADETEIRHTLDSSPWLQTQLHITDEYIALAGREDLIALRRARDAASRELWPLALAYGRWLARLPFVRMVALTGALAVQNARHPHDDLDYLLVTHPGRVWLARAFSILLVRLARLRSIEICPNYVLAETHLEQERHDIFIAHEVAQMVPLYGQALYERMRACNIWSNEYLPNASGVFRPEREQPVGRLWASLKWLLEKLLSGRLGDTLERWEYNRKLCRFSADMRRQPHHSARLDDSQVKGHFNDHGHFVLRRYTERLREYGLESQPAAD